MAGFMKNVMSYVGMADVPEDDDYAESDVQETSFDNDRSVTPAVSQRGNDLRGGSARANASRMSRITTIHPKSYDDAQMVGRALRDGVPVVLNLTGVTESVAYRIVDFSAGVVFGVRGSIERVTPRVFLLSPAQVNIKVEDAPNGNTARDLFS
ncbi:cell division protein SepF [Gardnerella sp. Marseille-Q9179]|uniref:cell division protein SepF n=1 Tax=Gardnerella TaxID=2701 RepID=UPI000ECF4B54|nr:cell division protein SepF [Bifidobacteriaceae bacterium NR015]